MRTVYDINGNDVTTSVSAAMFSSTVMPICDLYWFRYIDPKHSSIASVIHYTDLFMTSGPFPVGVNKVQQLAGPSGLATINATFIPARIKRAALNYEIGLKDQSVDVTWYIDDSKTLTSVAWGFKWAFLSGYFDESPIWIYKAIFSPPATPNAQPIFLGTTLMWRGFVRDVQADRGQVVLTVGSLMHLFQNTQIPTQTIQPGNRLPPYLPTGPGGNTIGHPLSGVVVFSTSTPTDIQLDFSTLGGSLIPDHAWRDWYFTVINNVPPNLFAASSTSGSPQPQLFRIRDNLTTNSPSTNTLHIYPYEPINPVLLVAAPDNASHFITIYPPQSLTGGAPGFPYTPPPEITL